MNSKTSPSRTAQAAAEPETQRRCRLALCDARARRIVVAQAVAATAVLAPLAFATNNTWQAAALLAVLVGSLLRWVTGRQLEKQLGDPAAGARAWPMTLAAHAVTSAAFALGCVACVMWPGAQPGADHATAIVVLATAVMAGSGLWALAPHRHASWAFIAPLVLVPAAVAFEAGGGVALGLAGALAATLAAAIALATVAERVCATHIATDLHARRSASRLDKLAREHEASTRNIEAREAERRLVFEHANVGLALVVDRRIECINPHLAQRLGQNAQTFEGQDVLQLLERESRDVVDAVARSRDPHRNSAKARLNLATKSQQGPVVTVITPIADAGAVLWVFKDAEEAPAASTASARVISARTARVDTAVATGNAAANGGFAPTQLVNRGGFAPTELVDRGAFAPTELANRGGFAPTELVDRARSGRAAHAGDEAPTPHGFLPKLPRIE